MISKGNLSVETWDDDVNSNDAKEAYNVLIRPVTLTLDLTYPYTRSKSFQKVNNQIFCDVEARQQRKMYLEANHCYILGGKHKDKIKANVPKKSTI